MAVARSKIREILMPANKQSSEAIKSPDIVNYEDLKSIKERTIQIAKQTAYKKVLT